MHQTKPSWYGFFWIVVVTLSFGSLALFCGLFEALLTWKWPNQGYQLRLSRKMRRAWASNFLKASGVTVELSGPGLDALRQPGACIMVSNHQSAMDIFLSAAKFPLDLVFFSKKELLFVPILGWAAWFAGSVYIDRKRGARDASALKGVQRALDKKNKILFFPEGTRSKNGELLPFKRGAFVLAIETQVPVLPISIKNSWEFMAKGSYRVKSGCIQVFIGNPISTIGMTKDDRHRLADEAREIIKNQL